MGDGRESIRALATVTLDMRAFDSEAIDRLAELVEERMTGRRGGADESSAERLLSVDAVAELAGCSRSLVYREIERGNLPAYKAGTRLRIEPAAVEGWKRAARCGRGRRRRSTSR